MSAEVLLPIALEAAVPLHIERLRALDDGAFAALFRLEDLDARAQVICGPGGEALLFRSKKPGESAALFDHVAESIALIAFCPGGVSIFGLHFEATR